MVKVKKISFNVSTGSNSYNLFEELVNENSDWKFSLAAGADVMILNNHPWEKLVPRKGQIINRYPNMQSIGRKDTFQKMIAVAEHFNKEAFDFIPRTFVLPQEYNKFKNY